MYKVYKQTELAKFVKQELKKRNYTTVSSFARDMNLDVEKLGKYLRGYSKFDLHYFMALVEGLELEVTTLYQYVYRNEKSKGLL